MCVAATPERGRRDNQKVRLTQEDARARLQGLVADGTIAQTEANVVLGDVIAGSVDPEALVRAGEVSAAHMPPIVTV